MQSDKTSERVQAESQTGKVRQNNITGDFYDAERLETLRQSRRFDLVLGVSAGQLSQLVIEVLVICHKVWGSEDQHCVCH